MQLSLTTRSLSRLGLSPATGVEFSPYLCYAFGVKKSKISKVDYSALNKEPEPHELDTANFFANLGFDIIFLKNSNIRGSHSPDFQMAGKVWEAKSPITYSESSFEDNFKKAEKQSRHIVFDLRRLNRRNEGKYLKELAKRSKSNKIKTLLVINKDKKPLFLKGKFAIIKA